MNDMHRMRTMKLYEIEIDGGGPSSPHYESQAPSLDRLEPCGERLDSRGERLYSRGERLAQDEGRLHKERLGGSLDRLGPSTFTHKWVKQRIGGRRTYTCYMEAH